MRAIINSVWLDVRIPVLRHCSFSLLPGSSFVCQVSEDMFCSQENIYEEEICFEVESGFVC